jgi:uncharacterized membrane protein
MLDGFLLGIVATSSVIAGLIFLRFWRDTRDPFFLAFAASFTIEGLNRAAYLLVDRPNEGAPLIYLVRLFAFLLILIAILRKNLGRS